MSDPGPTADEEARAEAHLAAFKAAQAAGEIDEELPYSSHVERELGLVDTSFTLSPIERALATIPAGTPLYITERVGDKRDTEHEYRANALYEELRLLTREQLAERAGHDGSKQTLIAEIITAELKGDTT